MTIDDRAFNNLTEVVRSLPAASYYDPDIHQTELTSVWYRNWMASVLERR